MNPILSILGGGNGGNIFGQILMQAIGAAIRGEPPPGMMEAYDLIHEWQMDHADEAQALIRRAKE